MLLLLFLTVCTGFSFSDGSRTVPLAASAYIDSSSHSLSTDSAALPIHFSIPKNYISYDDSDVIVTQFISDSTPLPVTGFIEYIFYNSNVLDFFDAQNASLTARPIWTVNKTQTTKGAVQVLVTSSPSTRLQNPGEVVKLFFHVQATAKTFDESFFRDSVSTILGTALPWNITTDTGQLLVIDHCVPILDSGTQPVTDQIYANDPVSNSATISYFVSNSVQAQAELSLYNAAGELVETKTVDGTPGWHSEEWPLNEAANGVYSLEYQRGQTRKFIHLLILH